MNIDQQTRGKTWSRGTQLVFLVLVVVLATVLKFADVNSRAMLEHDEGITLLGVTGHQGEFDRLQEAGLLDQWQQASAWQYFVTLPSEVSLKQIQQDLNLHDIHPPMYFWALSSFLQKYGQVDSLTYGLNWLFALAAIVMFYFLLRLKFERRPALFILAVFAFTPALAGPYAVLRQYELMMLCGTACLLMLSYLVSSQQSPYRLQRLACAGFCIFAFFGLMTHAQFVLVLAGLCLAILPLSVRWLTRMWVFAAAALAALIFVMSNPEFFHTLERLQVQRQDASLYEFLRRLTSVINGLDELIGLMPVTSAIVFAFVVIWALRECWLTLTAKNVAAPRDILTRFWLYSAVLVIGLILLQYLSMNSPRHAMGGRYLLPLLPFFVLLIALWLAQRQWLQHAWLLAVLLFTASTNLLAVEMLNRANKEKQIVNAMQQANAVLINNPTRGVLSPILPILPKKGQVVVMSPEVSTEQMLVLSEELQPGDMVWLQPGHLVSVKQCAEQLLLLQHRLVLREIADKTGVYVVLDRLTEQR